MELKRSSLPELGPPAGPYSHAVLYGSTLFTSGLTAFGSEAQQASVQKQVEEIFRQLALIASAHGTGLNNLVKVTVFIPDLSVVPELREALFVQYGQDIPASSMVMVAGLFSPDLLVEIEAVFAV
ncbi:RidA family protein [Kiloniella sp. b19]|uniref:RidA family protein n=1 Tax=Kiloniella sp. GXU_MW_B19 TaxID=3141326 RepID=UPI0031D86E82